MRVSNTFVKKILKPCKDQLDLWLELWPEDPEITRENVKRTVEAGVDLGWALRRCVERGEIEIPRAVIQSGGLDQQTLDRLVVPLANTDLLSDLLEQDVSEHEKQRARKVANDDAMFLLRKRRS